MSIVTHIGDPTLNKASEWYCAKCGHSEADHNLTMGTCEALEGCDCTGFEDME